MECGDLSPLFLLVAAFLWEETADGVPESADKSAHSKSEIVMNVQLVRLETINRFDDRRRNRSFKPCRGTPAILIGHRHQPMLYRILVNIVESGIGAFVSKFGVPEIEPHRSTDLPVHAIEFPCRIGMKMS